jgi:hypothetical protein
VTDTHTGTTQTDARTHTEQTAQASESAEVLALRLQLAQTQLQLQQSATHQADSNVRTVEHIERYVPAPGASGPSVVVVPTPGAPAGTAAKGEPSQVPVAVPATLPPGFVEKIDRITEAVDKGRTESRTDAQASSRTETHEQTSAQAESHTAATEKTDTAVKSATTDTTTHTEGGTGARAGAGSGGGGKLGVAVTTQLKPALTYDVTQLSLGPRVLGWGKLGAGLFITGTTRGQDIDGGPQLSFTPGKQRFFIGAGYAVRQKQTLIMGGFKF